MTTRARRALRDVVTEAWGRSRAGLFARQT